MYTPCMYCMLVMLVTPQQRAVASLAQCCDISMQHHMVMKVGDTLPPQNSLLKECRVANVLVFAAESSRVVVNHVPICTVM